MNIVSPTCVLLIKSESGGGLMGATPTSDLMFVSLNFGHHGTYILNLIVFDRYKSSW